MQRLILILFCGLWLGAANGQGFTIESYDVQVRVSEEAWFDVTETIVVNFTEQRRGIFREIPYQYEIDGNTRRIGIDNIKVDGWNYVVNRDNGQVKVRIGDADVFLTGNQRYVIRYRVKKAFNWRDTHAEFYWNVIGPEWQVPIREAAYAVHFPGNLSLTANDYRVFTGRSGQQGNNATIDFRNNTVFGQAKAHLAPREGITVAVRLPLDLVPQPSAMDKLIRHNKSLPIPAALIGLLSWLWLGYGRKRKTEAPETEQVYPPDNLSPSELGLLLDNTVNNRDIIALLPWWAAEGYIQMGAPKMDDYSDLNMRVERLKPLPEDAPAYQHTVFNELFKVHRIRFSKLLEAHLIRLLQEIVKALKLTRDEVALITQTWP